MKNPIAAFVLLFALGTLASADEGFWTFDNPPIDLLNEKYDITLSEAWLAHVQQSAIRFNTGGSASFISSEGLVLTNYHVGMGIIQQLSTADKNLTMDGFLATRRDDEIPAPDLEVNVLLAIEDITDRVLAAGAAYEDPHEAKKARDAEIARIEKSETEASGLRCDVVSLYDGARFKLYRYQKYTDVRLVFSPEMSTAFFGGIYDNYTYPRYSLDFALFRVYENDQPLRSEHYLTWNNDGPQPDEVVFVAGHPGFTDRHNTVAQLEFQRDVYIPFSRQSIMHRQDVINEYMNRSPEARRQALSNYMGIENLWKRYNGWYLGLRDSATFNRHVRKEQELKARIQHELDEPESYLSAWAEIAAAYETYSDFYRENFFARYGLKRGIFGDALSIVQTVHELEKPNEERRDDFRESNLDSFFRSLYSPAPVYLEKDQARLLGALEFLESSMGSDHPFVQQILQGLTPNEWVQQAFSNPEIVDPARRKQLVEGGPEAIETSEDTLIKMARHVGPILWEYLDRYDREVGSVIEQNSSRIAEARFKIYGTAIPPDANFTLRLSLGQVKGYENNGTLTPYKTTLYGLFDRAHSFNNRPQFQLPAVFAAKESELDLSTPYNFVMTTDSVGGNSGSPVINADGELVGLLFDGNMESIVGNYIYTSEKARSVAVHPAIMLEALQKVYGAGFLVDEILGR